VACQRKMERDERGRVVKEKGRGPEGTRDEVMYEERKGMLWRVVFMHGGW
jgi:hypothetical protein